MGGYIVCWLLQDKNNDWFPRMQAMSLAEDTQETDQPEQTNIREALNSLQLAIERQEKQLDEIKQVN